MQETTESSNVNVVMLQALQHMTVVAAIDRPAVVLNSQNNEIATIHNFPLNCSMVNIV